MTTTRYRQSLDIPMFDKFFKKKSEKIEEQSSSELPASLKNTVIAAPRLSLEEQKQRRTQRKRMVIDEFGKSVINFLYDGIWTPLHIIDFLTVNFFENSDVKTTIEEAIQKSLEIHKENLRQKIYKQSLNFQPGNLLMVVKYRDEEVIASFKNLDQDREKLVKLINPKIHKLFLVRHFIPPIPDDLCKYNDVLLPPKFEEALKDIVNYCDLNYSLDNLTFEKWKKLITFLSDSGTVLPFTNNQEEVSLIDIMTSDYSNIGYNKITVKQIVKDTVEKPGLIVISLFILLLAFFCSDSSERNIFSYHYLFAATGDSKELFMNRGSLSFPKLFNKLLDESLLPIQFNKCLSIIYNEAFRRHQDEINDLLASFRERYNQK